MSTSKRVDSIAGKLLATSRKSEVRSVAAAALSDTTPPAHTRKAVASKAGKLMHTGTKQERSIAASVLSDHKKAKRTK